VKEAGEHASEDKERRAGIEARNTADTRVYQIEKLLEENKDKVPQEDERAVRAAIEEVRKVLASDSKDAIEAAVKELDRVSHKLAEHLYQKGGAGTGQGAAGASSGPGGPEGGEAGAPSGAGAGGAKGDVIDAEYVDVDESKR
jgi:molecular chaperone DnaK